MIPGTKTLHAEEETLLENESTDGANSCPRKIAALSSSVLIFAPLYCIPEVHSATPVLSNRNVPP